MSLNLESLQRLNITACRLTENCSDSFIEFLTKYAGNLQIDLKLQNIKRGQPGKCVFTQFKNKLTEALALN